MDIDKKEEEMNRRIASMLSCPAWRDPPLADFLAFLFFVIAGCADTSLGGDTDGGSIETADAGESPEDKCPKVTPDLCKNFESDYCTDTSRDFINCGECGALCDPYRSDNCRYGECRCGGRQYCEQGDVCYANKLKVTECVTPDYTGEPCDEIENDACEAPKECVGGYCTRVVFTDEVCDGEDNDGDGLIDEDSDIAEDCYDGPPETLGVGPCQGGVRTCSCKPTGPKGECAPEWTDCIFQVLPEPEDGLLGCDGEDSNCDGCVDGSALAGDSCAPLDPLKFDIVFILDRSGSMLSTIDAVRDAMEELCLPFTGNDNFLWGLVLTPYPEDGFAGVFDDDMDSSTGIDGDLADCADFTATLAAFTDNYGGEEATYDAVYQIATGVFPLSFRADAQRVYILFNDEISPSPSYFTPELTESDMCTSMTSGEIFAAVIPSSLVDEYDCDFTGVTPTLTYELTSDVSEMVDNLNDLFEDVCDETGATGP